MTVHRKATKFGGSIGTIFPRDFVEAMGIAEGSPLRLSLVGRQVVIEPDDDNIPAATFRRAMAAVLRRHGDVFAALADHDAGRRRRGSKRASKRAVANR